MSNNDMIYTGEVRNKIPEGCCEEKGEVGDMKPAL
jgi:hypothetical protein